jgi:hypothetical protein
MPALDIFNNRKVDTIAQISFNKIRIVHSFIELPSISYNQNCAHRSIPSSKMFKNAPFLWALVILA